MGGGQNAEGRGLKGSRLTIEGGVRWQPDYHITIDLEVTHNDLTAQGNSFTADLYSARVKYAYSTSLYFGAFVQYNADVDQLVSWCLSSGATSPAVTSWNDSPRRR
jgi:hypothetical protein